VKAILHTLKKRYAYALILLKRLVITDFKLRYQGSVLGYLWTLLRPLALFAVLYVVFINFLRFGKGEPHFAVSLLLGIVLWNYFVEVTSHGLTAIVGQGDLLRKLSFPRYILVVAGSLSALINLVINLLVVGIFMYINGVDFRWAGLLAVLPVGELFIFSLSLAFLLSALYVKFRDINYVWEVVLQAAFYATPILYPISMVITFSPLAAQLMMLNPIAQIIQDARVFLINSQTPTIADLYHSASARLIPLAVVLVLALVAVYYFRRRSPSFAEEV
jgi:ABC-2 type transport system permease protein